MRSKRLLRIKLVSVAALLLTAFISACQMTPALQEYRKFAAAGEVPKMSIEDAKKDIDAGIAVMVDSRGEGVYNVEHIAGSLNIPAGSPKEKFATLPKDKKVIVYCSCAGEGTSIAMAFQMNQEGVGNTFALLGGTQAWKSAGLPMSKSSVVVAQ